MRRKNSYLRYVMLAGLGGGTLFAGNNGCLNTLLSIQVCGTIVPSTICTPQDQLALEFRFLQVPDFQIDPSCTIPFSCGAAQYPFGGTAPQGPTTTNGGGLSGGG